MVAAVKYLVVWQNGRMLGSFDLNDANRALFLEHFHAIPVRRDVTGTEHWLVTGIKRSNPVISDHRGIA